jgi:hypothetical protein
MKANIGIDNSLPFDYTIKTVIEFNFIESIKEILKNKLVQFEAEIRTEKSFYSEINVKAVNNIDFFIKKFPLKNFNISTKEIIELIEEKFKNTINLKLIEENFTSTINAKIENKQALTIQENEQKMTTIETAKHLNNLFIMIQIIKDKYKYNL